MLQSSLLLPEFLYSFIQHLHRIISDSRSGPSNYDNSRSARRGFRSCCPNFFPHDVHPLLLFSLLHSIKVFTTLSTSSIVVALCAIFITSLRSLPFSFLRTETAICIATSGFICS